MEIQRAMKLWILVMAHSGLSYEALLCVRMV